MGRQEQELEEQGVRRRALLVTELNTVALPLVPVLVKSIVSLASLFAVCPLPPLYTPLLFSYMLNTC